MKRFAIAFASLFVLSACNTATAPDDDDAMMDDDSRMGASSAMMNDTDDDDGMMDDDDAMMQGGSSSTGAMMQSSAMMDDGAMMAEARVIEMTVTDWNFAPSSITAKVGEKVIVRLTGATGMHSFGSAELGINVPVGPGETVDIEIPTDKAGTFSFRCMVPCGSGHMDMKGTIVIN